MKIQTNQFKKENLGPKQEEQHNLKGEKIVRKIIEIRAAEGGDDSKLFVSDLAAAYCRMFSRLG